MKLNYPNAGGNRHWASCEHKPIRNSCNIRALHPRSINPRLNKLADIKLKKVMQPNLEPKIVEVNKVTLALPFERAFGRDALLPML